MIWLAVIFAPAYLAAFGWLCFEKGRTYEWKRYGR